MEKKPNNPLKEIFDKLTDDEKAVLCNEMAYYASSLVQEELMDLMEKMTNNFANFIEDETNRPV